MNIFSRGSKKRKKFVEEKRKKNNSKTQKLYTETEAQEEYMKQKETWAGEIAAGFEMYCKVLCDPKKIRIENPKDRGDVQFWECQTQPLGLINKITTHQVYKNVKDGGSSYKYLKKVRDELGKVASANFGDAIDPENLKSAMQDCGKGLSKLKHPIRSTALVKVGEKGKRIIDYVDELARLMLDKSVQENAIRLIQLNVYEEWPSDNSEYKYKTVKPKYVSLES